MIKLLSLLGVGLFVTLLIGGEDNGQIRQGLVGMADTPETRPVLREAKAVPKDPAPKVAISQDMTQPAVTLANFSPVKMQRPSTSVIPGQFVVEAVESPAVVPAAAPEPVPELPIKYISSRLVNVRGGPSTNFGVVGQLSRAEAVTVIAPEENGWVRIAIEGDGLEGFIAARLLTDTIPAGN